MDAITQAYNRRPSQPLVDGGSSFISHADNGMEIILVLELNADKTDYLKIISAFPIIK